MEAGNTGRLAGGGQEPGRSRAGKNLWTQGRKRRASKASLFLPPSSGHGCLPLATLTHTPADPGSRNFSLQGQLPAAQSKARRGQGWVWGPTGQVRHTSQLATINRAAGGGADPTSVLADSAGRGCLLALRTRMMHDRHEKSNYDTAKITLPDVNMKGATN